MTQPSRLQLFQAYGVELEYMIVDRDSLEVRPISDELIKLQLGEYGSDFDNGMVSWSNELVLHVIELKSSRPESDLFTLEQAFAVNVKQINTILAKWNAMLLPSAAHPFMDPMTETRLWPHDSNEVYAIYNKIFDCKGHGWSNLQSTHINFPFEGDAQFAKLHAAIRLVLPILPALCASSPILDGKVSGLVDTRLTYYKTNQARIPSITGQVIPEPIFSEKAYVDTIYGKINADIAPFDPEQILDPIWVNSRGAITRFDRGSIEIRIMDIQECPKADLAIVSLVTETIKALVHEKFISHGDQMSWHTEPLAQLLDLTMREGRDSICKNTDYLQVFGLKGLQATAREIWEKILSTLLQSGNPDLEKWKKELAGILSEGTLSDRILKSLGGDFSKEAIKKVYRQLAGSLNQDQMFLP